MTRILIADDHDVLRTGLRALIETRSGWVVVAESRDGLEALRAAKASRPDIVVLDYAMPIMNGIEVARQLRARPPRPEILIFTMHDDDAILREAVLAGVRGYLLKSDAQGHLLEAIATLARHEAYISGQVSGTLLEAVLKPGNLQDGDPLTPRERTVVQLIGEGRTSREIGPILNVGIKTVESHRASAMRKIGATSTADIVRYAIRHRMVEV
ncbi:response regulator transcription factor [Microvirga sp. BT688]|uniref:response regulator n=1 Tax=Microvirga sp. TaxID=1873136 RepID=UPI001685C19C|nr:response regulator transcription factor [Microvirga sp.]MBD2750578.1 response regulator transcription factor [Microvirga sp.]